MSTARQFLQLPANPDQGLPQRFTFVLAGRRYEATLYANLSIAEQDPLTTLYDLSSPRDVTVPQEPPGFLVLRIDRRDDTGMTTVFLRKVVPEDGLEHVASDLIIKVRRAVIARGNLGGQGRYGSNLTLGVAPRWV